MNDVKFSVLDNIFIKAFHAAMQKYFYGVLHDKRVDVG